MLEAEFDVVQRGFEVAGSTGVQHFLEKTVAPFEAFAGVFPLLLKVSNFIADGLNGLEHGGVRQYSFLACRFVSDGETRLAEEFLE